MSTEEPTDAWGQRRRQLEIILRAYLDDAAALRLAIETAAFPARSFDETGIHAQGHVSNPTLTAVVGLSREERVLAWARWREAVVWNAYITLPSDLRNVIALTYWRFPGRDASWLEAARLMNVEQAHYYRLRTRALRAIDEQLPPESRDLAQWFGEQIAYQPTDQSG